METEVVPYQVIQTEKGKKYCLYDFRNLRNEEICAYTMKELIVISKKY